MGLERDARQTAMQVLGVCGGIGSGKSAACKLLVSELGCYAHIDADSVAHKVYEPGSQVIQDVASEFGDHIVDAETGQIDRKALGNLVFGDRQAMRKLEEIVWPHVRRTIQTILEELSTQFAKEESEKRPVVVVEAAVLLDAGWHECFLDAVWVVSTSQEMALRRLMDSRGLSREEAAKRIAAQQSRRGIGNLKEEVAQGVVTAVINNLDNDLDSLKQALSDRLIDMSAWYPTDKRV